MLRSSVFVLLITVFIGNLHADEGATVRVAAISFEPVKLDLKGNTQTLESWFRKAAEGGARIAVAPEGCLDGYIVNEIIASRFPAERMRDVAVSVESPTINRFRKLAKELDMCLVFGFAELRGDDVFNTALFIDNRGEIRGRYQKMQFHEGYDERWWFNRLGQQVRAFDTPYGRCGVLICNDRWNPLLAKALALDGAQFMVIPSFGSTSKQQDEAVLARGRETALPVIEANVGVSLIINEDRVAAVDRRREGITFANIRIPAPRPIEVDQRNAVEAEFLAWRRREMPVRLAAFVGEIDPRGPARDRDVATLETSHLKVMIGNNKSWPAEAPIHRAGYNGIFSIESKDQPDTPFVPAYAGMNLEHYFDAAPRKAREVFFEPRYATMQLRRINANTVELHQPPTPIFKVESWTRFAATGPHQIDFSFRCKPHRSDYVGDFLGVFWASYMNGPLNKSMYFIDGAANLEAPMWRQLCTQVHNRDSTIRAVDDQTKLEFVDREALFANESPLRYSVPLFYGRFRNMVLIYVFQPDPNLRFTHSPSGGGLTKTGDDTNPAWDFQLIIPEPAAGQEYELRGCLIYKKWMGRADVLAEAKKYLAQRDK